MFRFSTCLLLALLGACKPSASHDSTDAHAAAAAPTVSWTAPAPPKPPVAPPPATGTTAAGAACKDASECGKGLTCVFDEEGCAAIGHCRAGGVPVRNCYAAIPMCACRDHRTFYGPGGCAGKADERWELYACPCNGDADCAPGQRCVPVDARPHRKTAAKECRAPNEIR